VAITTDPHDQGRVVEAVAGHHETREQRHFKERIVVWIFISGDAVFLLMELFYWFYLRALNTDGMWRGVNCGAAALGLVAVVAAIVVQCYQFGVLPFTTIDGTYASTFEFFMGSTLAHLFLLAFIVTGLWLRAGRGRYDGGHWYQVRIIRIFSAWLAASTCILAIVMIAFS
jgi:fumarate reductase subunit D